MIRFRILLIYLFLINCCILQSSNKIEKIDIFSFDWNLHPRFNFTEKFILGYDGFYFTPENDTIKEHDYGAEFVIPYRNSIIDTLLLNKIDKNLSQIDSDHCYDNIDIRILCLIFHENSTIDTLCFGYDMMKWNKIIIKLDKSLLSFFLPYLRESHRDSIMEFFKKD